MAWHGSIAGRVDKLLIAYVMEQLPPLHTQYQVEVPFVQVNDSQSVYLGPAWVLLQHAVDYGLPPLIGIAKLKGIVQKCHVSCNDLVSKLQELDPFLGLGIYWYPRNVCFGMAQVNISEW